eukprot:TRINITY_DN32583_c0_g1_i1.p1 TRINITY_DN32583_c0_g1~~TRINITY_DN32583_c0_g1_i1.p1  ORF type:complete len:588 (+),score=137.30 TRINITY_DN32583_c0_g1_i1:153-1916(+)
MASRKVETESSVGKSNGPSPAVMGRNATASSSKSNARPASQEPGRRQSAPVKMSGEVNPSSSFSSNPLRLELNRLENELKVKGLDLEKLANEGKALKQTNIGKDKAIATLTEELEKLREKNAICEKQLESKVLELKKANDLKKVAFATQAAAEATSRRLQAAQKDVSMPSVDMILGPVEAELKMMQKEAAKLQADNNAQERLMRTKEAALMEAERAIAAADARLALVDDLQNKNTEFAKQIEGLQEENRTLDKMYKQKVDEVKSLTDQQASLKEALTTAGGVSSVIKDYQRQITDLQAALKLSQEELARAKVAVNRVAVVVANEWKDESDKVIPMKHWLDERKFMQGEAQSLRDKLAHAERAAKFESAMKEKIQLRLKVIEETLRSTPAARDLSRRLSTGGVSLRTASSMSPKSRPFVDETAGSSNGELGADGNSRVNGARELLNGKGAAEANGHGLHARGSENGGPEDHRREDVVAGVLYDALQKELLSARKASQEKDQVIKDRGDAVEMLSKKVDLLTKAMESESKKSRRELSVMEKEVASLKLELSQGGRTRTSSTSGSLASRTAPSSSSTSRKPSTTGVEGKR